MTGQRGFRRPVQQCPKPSTMAKGFPPRTLSNSLPHANADFRDATAQEPQHNTPLSPGIVMTETFRAAP